MRKDKPTHPILDLVKHIDKNYVSESDYDLAPKDPQQFLDWWWQQAEVCTHCVLCETRTTVAKPDGNANARIMVVLEGPGFLEDLAGIPLVGPMELRQSRCGFCKNVEECYKHKILSKPSGFGGKARSVECHPNLVDTPQLKGKFYIRSSGAVVDGILLNRWKFAYPRQNWVDFHNRMRPKDHSELRSPWFFTNIILCRSFDKEKERDTEPSTAAKDKCKKWLAYQWAAVQPEIIICFGRQALSVFIGSKEKAKDVRPNDLIQTKWGPVLFQNHPAYFMREENMEIRAFNYAKIGDTFERALQFVGLPVE